MKLKKLNKALVAAGLVASATISMPSQAVVMSDDGTGEVLIYPFYTVQGTKTAPRTTLVTINNTTNRYKAVKVRFHEAHNSRDALDFNLYLSPNDTWTGSVSRNADGIAQLTTADKSCTIPTQIMTQANPFSVSAYTQAGNNDGGNQNALRTNEGYIEVIEMGEINSGATTLLTNGTAPVASVKTITTMQAAIRHSNGLPGGKMDSNGLPVGCQALVAAAGNGGTWASPSSGGSLDNTHIGVTEPTGGLTGSAMIVQGSLGTVAAYNATALKHFYDVAPDTNSIVNQVAYQAANNAIAAAQAVVNATPATLNAAQARATAAAAAATAAAAVVGVTPAVASDAKTAANVATAAAGATTAAAAATAAAAVVAGGTAGIAGATVGTIITSYITAATTASSVATTATATEYKETHGRLEGLVTTNRAFDDLHSFKDFDKRTANARSIQTYPNLAMAYPQVSTVFNPDNAGTTVGLATTLEWSGNEAVSSGVTANNKNVLFASVQDLQLRLTTAGGAAISTAGAGNCGGVNGVATSSTVAGTCANARPVSAVLAKNNLLNEYVLTQIAAQQIDFKTDVVVTFPTKWYFSDNGLYENGAVTDGASPISHKVTMLETLALAPFSRPFVSAGQFRDQACERFSISSGDILSGGTNGQLFNQEEGTTQGQELVPSPAFNRSNTNVFCHEANVLTFNNGDLLNSRIANGLQATVKNSESAKNKFSIPLKSNITAGWFDIAFDTAGVHNMTSVVGPMSAVKAPVTLGVSGATRVTGLPAVGFVVEALVNGSTSFSGNFTVALPHKSR